MAEAIAGEVKRKGGASQLIRLELYTFAVDRALRRTMAVFMRLARIIIVIARQSACPTQASIGNVLWSRSLNYAERGPMQPFLQRGNSGWIGDFPARCAIGHIEGVDRRALLGADPRKRDRHAFRSKG